MHRQLRQRDGILRPMQRRHVEHVRRQSGRLLLPRRGERLPPRLPIAPLAFGRCPRPQSRGHARPASNEARRHRPRLGLRRGSRLAYPRVRRAFDGACAGRACRHPVRLVAHRIIVCGLGGRISSLRQRQFRAFLLHDWPTHWPIGVRAHSQNRPFAGRTFRIYLGLQNWQGRAAPGLEGSIPSPRRSD